MHYMRVYNSHNGRPQTGDTQPTHNDDEKTSTEHQDEPNTNY